MKTHCPSHETLTRFVEATLADPEADGVVAHLDSCAACSKFVEHQERTSDEPVLVSLRELQDGTHHDDNTDAAIPRKVGQYEILEKIGQGGMGTVYRAVHPHLKREVALKVIRDSHLSDTASRERFVQEMQSLGQLSHPNIVQATDAGVDGDNFFIVMELLDGDDLGSCVAKHGPISALQAVECIRQAAEGLAFAHKSGYVHRDIKPSNLFLTRDGVIKILDLGIARPLDNDDHHGQTWTGYVVGSPEFMAPEQFREGTVDTRSDIFSLGQTFHYLLTGQSQARTEANIPRSLQPVLARMTAGIPDQRFKAMSDVIASLDQLDAKRLRFRSAVITVAVLLITVLIGVWRFWPQPQVEHIDTDQPVTSASDNFEETWLSTQEISEHFGVSDDTIYRWIANNGMPARKAGRLWRFKKSEVDAWFKAGGAKTKSDNNEASAQ